MRLELSNVPPIFHPLHQPLQRLGESSLHGARGELTFLCRIGRGLPHHPWHGQQGFGARLGVVGPLERSDLVGLDLTKNIHDTLIPDLDVTPHAHPFLDALVEKGELGMKTGKGFRQWTPAEADAVRERLRRALVKSATQR